TPFALPKDLRAAIGFLAISALAAGLALPTSHKTAHVYRANPDHAPPGAEVIIEGANLMTNVRPPLAMLPTLRQTMAAPNAKQAVPQPVTGFVPNDASVFLGTPDKSRPIQVLDWGTTEIRVKIPGDAPLGDQKLMVFVATDRIGEVDFTVVDPKDQ